MKKVMVVALCLAMCFGFSGVAFADPDRGQRIYIRFLKQDCGDMDGGEFAHKHTQAEWQAIYDAGELNDRIKEYCPGSSGVMDRFVGDVFSFLHHYAIDSGNVPACGS